MKYEGTVSPEAMAEFIAYCNTEAETSNQLASLLLLTHDHTESKMHCMRAAVLIKVASLLDDAVQVERQRITAEE